MAKKIDIYVSKLKISHIATITLIEEIFHRKCEEFFFRCDEFFMTDEETEKFVQVNILHSNIHNVKKISANASPGEKHLVFHQECFLKPCTSWCIYCNAFLSGHVYYSRIIRKIKLIK